jgi:hypothetical protein
MMTDSQWQQGTISALNLEPWFKSANRSSTRDTGTRRAKYRDSAAAMARAEANIAQWMTYLPEDCVRAMVDHGWHWST